MSNKYIFITYGSKRIKGVQTKAINISRYLPKDELVVINHGDDAWLTQADLQVYNYNFNQFESPSNINPELKTLLDSAKAVIFGDFPTNMMQEFFIFQYVYTNTQIPLIVCDNIYNNKQFDSKIYSTFYDLADSTLLTGLQLFQPYLQNFSKAHLIPPYFDQPPSTKSLYRTAIAQKYKFNPSNKVVLHISYNQKVYGITQKIIEQIPDPQVQHIILLSNEYKEEHDTVNNIHHVYSTMNNNQMMEHMLGSDIVLCKFGYQQLLESLSLGQPTIALGDSGLEKSWLDTKLSSAFEYYPDYSTELVGELKKLLYDRLFYEARKTQVEALHNFQFNGAKKAAQIIQEVAQKPLQDRKILPKKIALTFNTKANIEKLKNLFQHEPFIMPVAVSNKFAERDFGYEKGSEAVISNIDELTFTKEDDFLDPSVLFMLNFSPVAYHGLSSLFPFSDMLLYLVEQLVQSADTIYLIGPEAESFFSNIIKRMQAEHKIEIIK